MKIIDLIRLSALLATITAAALLGNAYAADAQNGLLIINSYSVNTPWSQSFTQPINQKLSEIDNIHLELVNLNSALITDSAKYFRVADKIFDSYRDKKPYAVIMVGNFAFTLRDRIKYEWNDIPMLLITRTSHYAPLNYYFAGYEGESEWETLPYISEIRKDYNMTVIETPDFVQENIDLIKKVNPAIKKLVLIGDQIYTNRSIDKRIRRYLSYKYPNLQYEWLQQSDATIPQFQDYMLNSHPDIGFLLSTWSDACHNDEALDVTGGNLHMISSAVNPIFALRNSFLSMGSIGGVFCNQHDSGEALEYVLAELIAGHDMRNLPMFICDKPRTMINHRRMVALGLDESHFPYDTQYMLRTPTLWEQYRIEIIAISIIMLMLIIGIAVYINAQRKRIIMLKTHESFIKLMPWAYSKAAVIYGADGKVTDIAYDLNTMNAAFHSLLTANLIAGMECKMFPLAFIAEKTSQLIETGQPVSFTYHFELTDTYYEFLLCRINPQKLKDGDKPKYVDIFANNITKRVQAQKKLRTTMRTLDITLNVARIIPWQWDIEKGMIYYDGFRSLRRLSPSDDYNPISQRYSIDEASFINLVHPDDRQRIKQVIDSIKAGEVSHKRTEFKVVFKPSNKERVDWVEINAAITEYDADGKPKTVLGSLLVITERKRQEEALIMAKEQASESDRMKSAFLANMSHEIRTPLNAIVGFSSLITQTDDREQKAKYSGIIAHNNDLLLHLINDVLDLAKIESNTMELHYIDTDLNGLMKQIYETVRLRIAKGVMFNMVLGSETCYLKTDPNRLMQVLINLLTNAAKFTQRGSITYGYEVNDDEIEFFVQDTGIGISKENQERLFQRFSKLNNFMQGTGLGLSICKSFIEKMGGEIWVKSRGEGKGSTFMFTLPYVPSEGVEQLQLAEDSIIETRPKEVKDITILVAEDNESNYVLFESILSEYYNLIHAVNGREAVEMYKKYRPQLILMDIRMPEMDGYEATQEIRKISKSVPIIAVTAHAFVTEKDKIMKSGFNGYVAKPVNHNDLMNSVKAHLNKRFFVF